MAKLNMRTTAYQLEARIRNVKLEHNNKLFQFTVLPNGYTERGHVNSQK